MKIITIVVHPTCMIVEQGLFDPVKRAKLWFKGAGFECYVWAMLGVSLAPKLTVDKVRHLALLEAQDAHIPMMTIHDFGRKARREAKKPEGQLSLFDDIAMGEYND